MWSYAALGARSIRFEPARHVNTPMRLIETISWQRTKNDGPPHAYDGKHCRIIAFVIGCLCDASAALSEEQETVSVLTTFMATAVPVEGHTTYGTSGERYEAARALKRETDENTGRPISPPHYLVDTNTGELVVAVSDLESSARYQLGSGLSRGWLPGRMKSIGFTRHYLQGYSLPGREGRRQGAHAHRHVFRGVLPNDPDEPTGRRTRDPFR